MARYDDWCQQLVGQKPAEFKDEDEAVVDPADIAVKQAVSELIWTMLDKPTTSEKDLEERFSLTLNLPAVADKKQDDAAIVAVAASAAPAPKNVPLDASRLTLFSDLNKIKTPDNKADDVALPTHLKTVVLTHYDATSTEFLAPLQQQMTELRQQQAVVAVQLPQLVAAADVSLQQRKKQQIDAVAALLEQQKVAALAALQQQLQIAAPTPLLRQQQTIAVNQLLHQQAVAVNQLLHQPLAVEADPLAKRVPAVNALLTQQATAVNQLLQQQRQQLIETLKAQENGIRTGISTTVLSHCQTSAPALLKAYKDAQQEAFTTYRENSYNFLNQNASPFVNLLPAAVDEAEQGTLTKTAQYVALQAVWRIYKRFPSALENDAGAVVASISPIIKQALTDYRSGKDIDSAAFRQVLIARFQQSPESTRERSEIQVKKAKLREELAQIEKLLPQLTLQTEEVQQQRAALERLRQINQQRIVELTQAAEALDLPNALAAEVRSEFSTLTTAASKHVEARVHTHLEENVDLQGLNKRLLTSLREKAPDRTQIYTLDGKPFSLSIVTQDDQVIPEVKPDAEDKEEPVTFTIRSVITSKKTITGKKTKSITTTVEAPADQQIEAPDDKDADQDQNDKPYYRVQYLGDFAFAKTLC